MPWVAIAIAAVMVVTAMMKAQQAKAAGKQNRRMMEYNAGLKDREAAFIEQETLTNAELHEKQARRIHSKTATALTSSGLIVNEGSPLSIQLDDVRNAEIDRQMLLRSGTIAAANKRQEASMYRYRGYLAEMEGNQKAKNAMWEGFAGAATTVAGGYAGMGGAAAGSGAGSMGNTAPTSNWTSSYWGTNSSTGLSTTSSFYNGSRQGLTLGS